MATLYLVSTPIGNLDDITLRALKILADVPVIACEDTRKTGQLLNHHQLKRKQELISYFEGNEIARIPLILAKLSEGSDVALVTNAGTPSVSDPGFKLVRAALGAGIKVIPVPGPSAVLAAVTAAGLPTDRFLFLGFLPKKSGHRQKYLSENLKPNLTTVIYLSPYRLLQELDDLNQIAPEANAVLFRELTKVFEESLRGKISDLLNRLKKEKIKGEFTLVVNLDKE
ncbi:MAG: Ribosomal RNA small subunit methyltransferase I [Microgenomates group bacterium ADurb.Bin219]|nr:MAG: Ribosomal RNA small subunit methyltransferase I [Microgenomates group bacterium ADurb.Bin219]HNP89456.1 16S rRNA (cytidine(1402)-2'-O)-methyltransferase [Candidatus Woesebacteria bacterium]